MAFNIFCLLMLFDFVPASTSPVWLLLGTLATVGIGYVDCLWLIRMFVRPLPRQWRLSPRWFDWSVKLYVFLHAGVIVSLMLTGGVAVLTLFVTGYFTD